MSDSSRPNNADSRSGATLHARCTELVDFTPYAFARTEAEELGGRSPDPLSTEMVRMIARLINARASVCIASAPGVAALAVLAGSRPDATVTCITEDPHHLDVARRVLREAGHPSSAGRFISSRPLDVVDKLADNTYDLLVADVPTSSVGQLVVGALRLLRQGGALVLLGEYAPLPSEVELPDHAHISMLPIGKGLTVINC